ncbi:MAG: DUF1156 domain-containing protein [Candidatus Bathyarchaeales archaeon]
MNLDERFIEAKLPLSTLNKLSTKESSFIRVPKIHNLHTWFARRPAGASRALTLASIFPKTLNEVMYNQISSLSEAEKSGKVIYMVNPNRRAIEENVKAVVGKTPSDIVVLDPMAGGGSIPLESARLGFRTIAVDYNPVAYLILKAGVEFPAKYADAGLFEETLKVSKDFVSKVRQKLGKYYGEGVDGYILARGVRCPFCNGLIPIQGVEPAITKASRFKKRFLEIKYDKDKKSFFAQTTDRSIVYGTIAKRGNNIKCPYESCGKWFQLRGQAKSETTIFDHWFQGHAQLMESVVEDFAPITSEIEDKMLNLHVLLVKQIGNSFHSIWEDKAEKGKFTDSLHDLSNELLELQNYIPLDEISLNNKWASTARSKKISKWYMLFNPRQLLTITTLTKLIAETAEDLASKNGEFGAAIATYLALALDKIVDYNTIATSWQGSSFKTGLAHTLRGESTLDFRKEYCEAIVPYKGIEWALETDIAESNVLTRTAGGVLSVLRFLCSDLKNAKVGNHVNVYIGDATQLSNIVGLKSVDIINVDPPYFEQVIYSDRSEFFWVILRRALAPVLELLFKPNLKLTNWTWTNPTVPREREVVTYDKEDAEGRFSKFFQNFIAETSKVLKDDGVLTLWFTHPTAQAWRVVSESLYENNYVIPKVWPLQTEMKTRYKKQVNIVAQEMTLVIIGRKYPRKKLLEISPQDIKGSIMENPAFTNTVTETVEDTRKIIIEANTSPADTAALMFGTALSVASQFELPIGATFSDIYDAAITAVISRFVRPLITRVLIETGPIKLDQTTSEKITKSIAQSMLLDPASRSYLTLWLLSRVDLATGKIRQDTLGLHFDLVQTVGKLCGFGLDNLKHYGLVTEKTIDKSGKAYYPQFLEMLTLPGGKALPDRIKEVAPGLATILARAAITESGDPAARAKTIRAKMSMTSDRELSSNAALAILLLETTTDQDLGFKVTDKTKISGYLQGMDESEAARIVRELAIKTLTQLIY